MPRQVPVPPTATESDKIIGGKIDLIQLIWMFGGLIIGAMIIITLSLTLNFKVGILLAFPFLFLGVPFAFVKKHGLSLSKYLKYRKEFESKQKIITNPIRKEG